MRRMGTHSKRASLNPRGAEKSDSTLVALRMSRELVRAVDQTRGKLDRSSWIRDCIEARLSLNEDSILREVERFMRRRGVSVEMLSDYVTKKRAAR